MPKILSICGTKEPSGPLCNWRR